MQPFSPETLQPSKIPLPTLPRSRFQNTLHADNGFPALHQSAAATPENRQGPTSAVSLFRILAFRNLVPSFSNPLPKPSSDVSAASPSRSESAWISALGANRRPSPTRKFIICLNSSASLESSSITETCFLSTLNQSGLENLWISVTLQRSISRGSMLGSWVEMMIRVP